MNEKKVLDELLEARIPLKYAKAAVLSREVLKDIFDRLNYIQLQPRILLDIGCATGDSTAMLINHYPDARVIAIDSSPAMIDYATKQGLEATWHAAPYTNLPLPDHSVDLLLANLVMPWCEDVPALLREWRRVLRPAGVLMFATFGPDTLRELHDLPLAFPHMMDMHTVGDLLVSGGFQHPVLDVDYITLTFSDLKKMWEELQVTGMIAGKTDTLQPKKTDDRYVLTHEIIFGHAFLPDLSAGQVPDEKGEVRIPLSQVGRRRG
ncbi:MAG TPA: methyltransferase domain-containing protein [Gammaproteobacteria bacterium]|nr:methyltransferase domain-containing protein [Gammaproteobacteria bacterium]